MPDDRAYPSEPWRLVGELELAAWLIPPRDAAFKVPEGWRPLRLFGRRLVGGVFARYASGGDLAYRELAVGVVVRRGWRLAVTIPWIWVDEPRALEGGRRLWAIPKQPARFRHAAARLDAEDAAGRTLAALQRRVLPPLPGRWTAALTVAQTAEDGARLPPARLRGRLTLARSRWRGSGPLRMLDGRAPFVSLRLDRAEMLFGSDRTAREPPPGSGAPKL